MDILTHIRKPIEEDIVRYREMFLACMTHDNPMLDYALKHLAQRPGKMMRPILGMLVAKAFGGVNEATLHAVVSLELLHTASLVHDDVLDESDRRRGQKSVNALMNNWQAVLVGDFLLSRALEHASLTGDIRVVEAISKLGQTLADGELLQIFNTSLKTIDEESYYKVIERKTASLFATCAYVGAILGGADDENVERMRQFGLLLGLCFQIRDDIFDYNPTADLGKPSGIDMKEGKLTLPVIHAVMKLGNEAQYDLALRVRGGDATDEHIRQLIDFAISEGGIEYAKDAMQRHCDEAVALLADIANPSVYEALTEYVQFVAKREL